MNLAFSHLDCSLPEETRYRRQCVDPRRWRALPISSRLIQAGDIEWVRIYEVDGATWMLLDGAPSLRVMSGMGHKRRYQIDLQTAVPVSQSGH